MLFPSRAKGNKHAIMVLLPYKTFMANMVVNTEYVRSQHQYSLCWLSWPASFHEEFCLHASILSLKLGNL